ncbi:hypothetical protein [Lysobacter firmicutimachus]|uniref:Uncharacterized protein n=1 Tax=Lysobacter firmicutimachus TaxID=1792846 RepID=A0ABU8D367_9GAMM
MNLHWKDLETDGGQWFGLALQCRMDDGRHRKPPLHLESGDNGRIRLVQECAGSDESVVRFWATLLSDYEGVYWLRGADEAPAPVPASTLDSAIVERHAALPQAQRLPGWSRVFAQALAEGPASFLYPGLWVLMAMRPKPGTWTFETEPLRRAQASWWLEDARDALREDPLFFIDWWHGRYPLLNLRAPAAVDDGRLKWWRKKAREEALPPVLLWYLSCLNGYVIVDGHLRLQAALLEDRPPSFLVAYSAYEQAVRPDPAAQRAILDSYERHARELALRLPQRRPIGTDSINATLIAAFDDRPLLLPRSYGWATRRPEAQWLDEVRARLAAIGRSEAMDEFAAR